MRRTSILLDPGLLAELERIARRQDRPTAHVIRDALTQFVSAEAAQQRSLPGFVGLGRSPGAETAEPTAPSLADASAPAEAGGEA
ncbi:MAG: ribbon-helix-helix domain-containing protein [Chloroflexota bacterium]|jgi:hypothetical protein|nr:ribbon-helix-helix domain-containing protein [Chloroflexota bacterium]